MPAEALVLEVTETTSIVDFERSKLAIEQLRDLSIIVSVDDFGAGFTSLAYLSSLAVGELKLDRSFIKGLSTAEKGRDLALVRSTIELAHSLGLRVVAEGVEDNSSLDLLDRARVRPGPGLLDRPCEARQRVRAQAHPGLRRPPGVERRRRPFAAARAPRHRRVEGEQARAGGIRRARSGSPGRFASVAIRPLALRVPRAGEPPGVSPADGSDAATASATGPPRAARWRRSRRGGRPKRARGGARERGARRRASSGVPAWHGHLGRPRRHGHAAVS